MLLRNVSTTENSWLRQCLAITWYLFSPNEHTNSRIKQDTSQSTPIIAMFCYRSMYDTGGTARLKRPYVN